MVSWTTAKSTVPIARAAVYAHAACLSLRLELCQHTSALICSFLQLKLKEGTTSKLGKTMKAERKLPKTPRVANGSGSLEGPGD